MSTIKVNNIQTRSGSTLTLGTSGDTVTLASGATQSGFGASGAVSWDTTEKTSAFTAVSGTGYFVDTSSSAITATLPASPSAGDIVGFKDYAGTFATNNLTIGRNSSNIQGGATDSIISTNRASVILVYVDATVGWLYTVESNVSDLFTPQFIAATGGTITTEGDYKIHTFTSSGTFTVSNAGNPTGNDIMDYVVVAGGGGGGGGNPGPSAVNPPAAAGGGGGGAGGFRESAPPGTVWESSALVSTGGGLTASVQSYPITIGGGGAGGPAPSAGTNGANSIFSTITSAGGGGGAGEAASTTGANGGSGGGGAGALPPNTASAGGTGNTPSVNPPQGKDGGDGTNTGPRHGSGGGGGALEVGQSGAAGRAGGGGAGTAFNPSTSNGTPGPQPATIPLSQEFRYFAGGGGGDKYGAPAPDPAPAGGTGGGGTGKPSVTAGTTNTGGGGGGASEGVSGAAGGSGIVMIRYKFQ